MEGGFFQQALVYLAAAVISVPIAKRLGLGSVMGYLLAGIIIGPFVLHFIGQEGQDVMHFAEFGVVMMLFLIGLELKPSLLWKMRLPILGLGGAQVGITTLVILIIGLLVGLTWQVALAIGLTLALSSTAIVLQTLQEKNLTNTTGGKNIFSVLLFQDLALIPMLAIMPLLATGHATETHDVHEAVSTWTDGFPVWAKTLTVVGAITLIIVAGNFLISPIFRWIAKSGLREIFTAAALLLVIAIAYLMTQVGLSPALGTFLAGVILAQSEYRHELETDIEPFKGLLLGLFFIAVGASIDFKLVGDNPLLIAELVVGLILIKFVVLFLIGKVYKMGLDNNFLFAFSMAQGGEFAFVLFSFALSNQVLPTEIANTLIAVVALTMAITPLIMLLNEKFIQPRFGTKEKVKRDDDEIDEENSIIVAGFGKMGSIVGRFIQACGLTATYLDLDPDNVDLLRRLGLKVYYGDASRADLLKAAGAGQAKILIIAVNEANKITEITTTAQKHFPHLKIYARSTDFRNTFNLMELGVENIYRETYGSAMQMAEEALAGLGMRRYLIHRLSKKFTKHNDQIVLELSKKRKDSANLIKDAKQHFQDMEKIMLEEQAETQKDKDVGWDPSTMIVEFKKRQSNASNT